MRNLPARLSLNLKPWDFVFRNYNDRTGGKHPKTHTHKELLFSVKPMHTGKKKMHLTCNSSNLNYSRLCPTHPHFLATVLFSYEGSEKKGQSELLTGSIFLFYLAQDQGHFCKSSPTAPPPLCSLLSSIIDFFFFT